MRKNAVGFLALAAVLILLSGCSFNLFSSLDTVKIPSASDLLAKASSNAKGFIQDVQDYLDSGAITEDNADDVITALEDVYTNPEVDTETGQKAAVLAGEILITTDPATKGVVDNVVSVFADMLDPNYVPPANESETESMLKGLFPTDESKFDDIYANLKRASVAYTDFANTLDSDNDGLVDTGAGADWVASDEKGDIATYAVVSIAVASIPQTDLKNFLYYDGTISGDPLNDSNTLLALLDFASLSL